MDKPSLPLPPQPPSKPRGFCFVYSAVLLTLVLIAVMTFFVMGTIWPFLIGFGVLAIIALQYLVWGWWFERIYRTSQPDARDDSFNREP